MQLGWGTGEGQNGGKTEQIRGRGNWHMVKQNKRPGNTKHKYDQQRAAGKQSPRTGELTEHVVNTYTQVYYEHSGVRLRLGVTVPSG